MEVSGGDREKLHLYSLPNEVFVQILTPFSTRDLLPMTTVSHRFHALILRILHYRLLIAASLKEYKLILECFHPSSKLTEPHVFCTYLGTDGLSDRHEGEGSLYENVATAQRLARLTSLYSRFQPEARVDEQSGNDATSSSSTGPDSVDRAVKRTIHLEESEDFSQLCVVTNIVKVVPSSHLLLSAVTVKEGIVRIWRDWLKDQAGIQQETSGAADTRTGRDPAEDDQMLWVDEGKNVGLKLRVKEKRWNRNFPILIHRDEETSVSYEVEIQELHIRTTRLMMTVEQSVQEQQSYTNAVIFGAFHPRAVG